MEKLKIAVAGLGSRGNTYSIAFANMKDRVELVAAADILPDAVERYAKKFNIPRENWFNSAEELLEKEKMADVLVISTPDRCHYKEAKAALEKGYHLLLEKPISPVKEECLEIAELAKNLNRQVVVCHVLRYTPFYGKLKEIIDSGELGDVVSVEAIEQVCYWHQAHSFVRGNWRNKELSSPMILQKSCHDMDILLWLTGKHCKAVSSFGHLNHFKKENAPAGSSERCTEACPQYKTCPYSIENCYFRLAREGKFGWPVDVVAPDRNMEQLVENLKDGPYGRCVYHCDNDVVDHQIVNILLEDNATITFSMSAFTGAGGRRIHVMGTKGDIFGDMEAEELEVRIFNQPIRKESTKLPELDIMGHGGGDDALAKDIVDLLTKKDLQRKSLTSIENSVESHLVALAAEESRLNGGKVINF